MALQLVNRYKQLLVSVPKGSFYASDGQVLPHRDSPYELRISTGVASREYAVYCNESFKGLVVTNASGIALVTILLDLGRNDIRLVDTVSQTETLVYITTRDYATWLAAEAEVIEKIDEGIEQVLQDARLATASASLIEDTFGRTVQTGNSFSYDLETYRQILTELRAAYRSFGGTYDGISRAVRAFTTISPLIYPRSFGPRWILGKDFICPEVDVGRCSLYTTSPFTNINAGGAGISITAFDSRVGVGSGTVKCYGALGPRQLSWTPPNGAEGALVTVGANGSYTLYGANYFDPIIGEPGPFTITAGRNDQLALDIDNKGVIVITLTAGAARTAAQIATDINTALAADSRYGVPYNAVAASYDPFASGSPMVSLTTPNATTNGQIAIHLNPLVDAAQTLFSLPDTRNGLSVGYLAGVTSITASDIPRMANWPQPTPEDPLPIIVGHTTYHPPISAPNAPAAPASTELVYATNINRTTGVITLAAPGLANAHNANELIYVAGLAPYVRTNVINSRSITVNVANWTLLPVVGTVSDAITVSGTGLPDTWVLTTNAGAAPTTIEPFQPHVYFDNTRDLAFGLADDHMVQIPIDDDILRYRGFGVMFQVWTRIDDPSRAAPQATFDTFQLSADNRATWINPIFAINTAGIANNAEWRPVEWRGIYVIPADATKVWMRMRMAVGNNGYLTIHRVRLSHLPGFGAADGLFLGDGTIPRGESQIKHGAFMYVWSPKQLTVDEKKTIGVNEPVQTNPGHIDKLAPDFAWIDKFDVSTYDGSGNPTNIKGAFDETEFLAGSQTNLGLVLRSPSRFTYLVPECVSEITDTLTLPAVGPFVATLTTVSDQDKAKAALLENGIPIPQDQWQFNSSTQVELLFTPTAGAAYQLRYNALIRFETADIDLGASFADLLWFADYDVFLRPEVEGTSVSVTTGIQFDGNGVATLTEKSNENQAQGTLIEDTGVVRRIIPSTQWSFLDGYHVSISTDIFEPAALYEFTYMAEVNHPAARVGVTVEIKSATSQVGLGAAVYSTAKQNRVMGSVNRWHKMRITLNNIRDVRDAKVFSLLLKGFNLFGVPGTVPILRP